MSLKVFELFGYAPNDTSSTAASLRAAHACPFVKGNCTKRLKSGLISGVCAVKPATSGPVICCPNRMYASGYAVLQEVAADAFDTHVRLCHDFNGIRGDGHDVIVFGKRWGKELRLPGRGARGGYFVDWILARLSRDHSLAEFVAVELQTMDTTGSYEAEVRAYLGGKTEAAPSKAGINWENVAKRILPQIIFKPIFDTSDKNRREEVRFDGGFDVSERKTWCHE